MGNEERASGYRAQEPGINSGANCDAGAPLLEDGTPLEVPLHLEPLINSQEWAILAGFAAGSTRMAIAAGLHIPVNAVDEAVASALQKLHQLNRPEHPGEA